MSQAELCGSPEGGVFCQKGHLGRVPEDGQEFHRDRDEGEEERLFRAEGTASARRERQERWEVLEAQGIVSIGCDGEEIEVRAAKLGWAHIIRDLEYPSGSLWLNGKGIGSHGQFGAGEGQDQSTLAAVWAGSGGWTGLISIQERDGLSGASGCTLKSPLPAPGWLRT